MSKIKVMNVASASSSQCNPGRKEAMEENRIVYQELAATYHIMGLEDWLNSCVKVFN